MNFSRPLTLLTALCCLFACNRTGQSVTKDSPKEYRKNWQEYMYASSLLPSKNDSAFFYFNKIATNSKDSLLVAGAYTQMGIIQHDAGDYFGSQETLLQSLNRLNGQSKPHRVYLASSFNELGQNSHSLKNYDEAIRYYNQAIKFSNDDSNRPTMLNNKATAYKDKRQYALAISIYNAILHDPKNKPDAQARILSNLAYTQWLQDPGYNAAPELWTALQIRKNENDHWGLTASYRHLSEYYTQTHPDSALYYADELHRVARQLKSPDDEQEALTLLIPLSTAAKARIYFNRLRFLFDSIQTARNSAKNQFALIRYETEKHKADKLILQKQNAENRLRMVWQWVLLGIVIATSVTGFIWYRKRRQQAMKEHQLKTSQKVHDVVANGLYSIMAQVEYAAEIKKDQLLDEMEVLYEQSRNLSYEPVASRTQDDNQLPALLKSFSTPETRVSIAGYTATLWNHLSPKAQNEVKHALQNLMINMKKHSGAKNAVVKFEELPNELYIQYTDDGRGLPANFSYGNGLSSTETRIAGLGGRLSFDRSLPRGVKIQIFIPIK